MLGELIPVGGGDPIPLLKPRLLIGRRSSCDIVLDYPNVSSQHCELELVTGFWRVRDLGSSNGTKVNGERVLEKFVQPGDTIAIARHKFQIAYQAEINTTSPDTTPPDLQENPFAMSLMEKAGLVHRPRPPSKPKQAPSTRASKPAATGTTPANDDPQDDAALEWLNGSLSNLEKPKRRPRQP